MDGRVTSVSAGATGVFVLLLLLSTLIGFLYFPFFWARGGQTPGMRPFSLRVVKDSDGTRIGWGTAILRLIGMWVAVAVLYIGLIWIFVDKRRRGWQDLIAGTVVVKRHLTRGCERRSRANRTARYPCRWRGGRAVDGGALEKR